MNTSDISRDRRILDYERKICCNEMHEYLDIMSQRYNHIKISSIGMSILGADIPLITIGNGKKEILYVGTIHGCDMITCAILLRFINEYCEIRQANRRIYNLSLKSLEETRTIHIVPMANPDGASYYASGIGTDNPLAERITAISKGKYDRWKANARGVDLNRNFNFKYIEYRKQYDELNCEASGASFDYPGGHPESEPESAALGSFIRSESNLKLVLDFSCGQSEIEYSDDSGIPRAKSIAQSLSRISNKPLSPLPGSKTQAGFTGWCSDIMKIPAYRILCGNDSDNGCFKKYAGVRELLFTAPVLE